MLRPLGIHVAGHKYRLLWPEMALWRIEEVGLDRWAGSNKDGREQNLGA